MEVKEKTMKVLVSDPLGAGGMTELKKEKNIQVDEKAGLSPEELKKIIRISINKFEDLYINGFIAEGPEKMLQIPQHYEAVLGKAAYPATKCNAPWVSAVIESNGDVLPCFFHKSHGIIHENNFAAIINSEKAIQFRKQLDISKDKTCQKCVCALHIPFYKSAS